MVTTCSAYGCTSKKPSNMWKSFHRVPKDPELRSRWVAAIGRKDWTPGANSVLCSDHFALHDYDPIYKRKTLKPGVVPSIFNVSSDFNVFMTRKRPNFPAPLPPLPTVSRKVGSTLVGDELSSITSKGPRTLPAINPVLSPTPVRNQAIDNKII